MRRRRNRSNSRDGLFEWTPDGDTIATEIHDNPRARECRRDRNGCGAGVNQPCTRPARGGRKPIRGYHEARKSPQETE